MFFCGVIYARKTVGSYNDAMN